MFGFLKEKLSDLKKKIVGGEEKREKERGKESKTKEATKEKKKRKPAKVEKTKKVGEEKKKGGKVGANLTAEKTNAPKAKEPIKEKSKESLLSKIKKSVSRKFKLTSDELDDYTWDINLLLLEADVAHEVVEDITTRLKNELKDKEFSSRDEVFEVIKKEIESILSSMIKESKDITMAQNKPTIIMFVGPNGAGKTTTIAKLANKILKSGKTVIFAASDTFRAASIEQLEEHANKLGVKVIKHGYGADPAAVAYDAVKAAKARGIDFVMIDTAGRQETNKNLIEELKKIKKVVKPHFTIYVDEGIAGNVIFDRLKSFDQIGLDGVILTKMDLDVKGGGVITSASFGIPIMYFGVGQEYDKIEKFDKSSFLKQLLG